MSDLDRYQYGYDQNSNRLWKANVVGTPVVSGGLDEYYSYDTLNRLTEMQRGTLNSGKTGITGTPSREMDYTLDPTGNWSAYLTKTAGTTDLNQIRSHSPVNEITAITSTPGWATPPGYDAAGNMNSFPQPAAPSSTYTAVYDAWNRMVSVSAGGNTVAQYQYDGSNRRAVKLTYSGGSLSETRHFYYTSDNQDIEERVGTSISMDKQFVWGIRYVDELICRDDAAPERLYACQDANFNVTALIDTSGAVQQRFLYDPYGTAAVLTGAWASTTDTYAWTPRFTGQFFDPETEIYYYRARYYQPQLGRFIERDPLSYVDGPNLYLYCNSSPHTQIDPTGMSANCCGPKIDALLQHIRSDVFNQFLLSPNQVQLAEQLIRVTTASGAWDIPSLRQQTLGNADCGTGTGSCVNTVTVNGKCFPQGEVNYWLAGVIDKILDDYISARSARLFVNRMSIYVSLHDKITGQNQAPGKLSWMDAGYLNDFSKASTTSNLGNCTSCGTGDAHFVSWNWGVGNIKIGGSVK